MPSYQITLTHLDQLEDALRCRQILGVGMLSHFLRIAIAQSWRNENVYIQSMYDPENRYCEFNFKKQICWIQNGRKIEQIKF
jgi:hypothetical protein